MFFGVSFKREVTRVLRPLSLEEIAAISPELIAALQDDEMKDGAWNTQGAFLTFLNLALERCTKS